ncbi:DNA-directed primase/polymerase protein isoform X1 [Falco biarmicus]|uniref:DNA-directed primase/polymerase protein isoform X1 n=2 Tax=Falco biarmicus TaxID=345155 RepID=UPI0024BD568E|nr:DNA-directed primase/polymerase protein isoform X1 [Falco biarmicus]XP_056182285.1 DNA-directed primase/polymerase protein isoform X1 [Falco biarmicus]XP_056182286.1 DNA-directed primase/polymerase protein isoform X1 [Falco biarmicus]XP_056182287.1 DNA-directed primase/polymerase protein isoform X1 [Falco biarmicus]XP_056182288.1 DNA-directed primase/polymerase protein isoform X1 [Falco biarmicus]XP_056182289.1 DNA-directed primase/polymerase protein isoform X1 [Falco biarmicus]XP_05618229
MFRHFPGSRASVPVAVALEDQRGQIKRKWEERLKKVEELASHYERNPLPPVYRPKLSKPSEPSSVWKIFCRQAEAFQYAKTCEEDVHVFALEKDIQSAQRFYLVTSYKELWFYYTKGYKTSLMHCYEVIPEKDACKLYFDLEFYKPANPDADGKSMVAKLIELVSQKLKELYDVNCSAKDVLDLDSSTDEKFSRHLIFLLQKAVFKDNIHAGNFVRTILQPAIRLMESKAAAVIPEGGAGCVFQCSAEAVGLGGSLTNLTAVEDASRGWPAVAHKTKDTETSHQGQNLDFSFLMVNDKEGNKQLFVDLGVYTKNRNFRMYKSSKAGKNVILKISEDNKFVPNCEEDVSLEEAYFLSSLICNVRVRDDTKVLSCGFSKEERKMSSFSNSRTTRSSRDSMEGYQGSPYPEIDYFVRSLVNKDGVQGGIRQWRYFSQEEKLVYDISGYRWCENIGRAHKSNNIMILVDLKKEVWYQKCHDPVCREENFRSQSFPLPPTICLPFLFKEEEEYTLMDERGNTEEKVKPHSDVPDLSKSSVSLEKSLSRDFLLSDSEWDNTSDDSCFLEATEDVELAEAVNDSLNYATEEIPDEVLLETSSKQDTCSKGGS